jgi:2-polyprenyl-3-methyl-5-hydroxy-6-metoxy-1,4-benzoquinol methylase
MNNEMRERYPIKADRHSSHSQILKQCGEGGGQRLLDVGCARGHLASALAERGWEVTGVEYDPSDAQVAKSRGLNIITSSAEDAFANLTEKYDVIVFADVLEHLVDPLTVLKLAKNQLTSDGRIVISIPNVAHLTVRLQLFFGSFTYSDRGILDRTHLHFYTKKTLAEMITKAGLHTLYMGATPAPIEEVLPSLRTRTVLRAFLELNAFTARTWKSGLAYQYIAVAKSHLEI